MSWLKLSDKFRNHLMANFLLWLHHFLYSQHDFISQSCFCHSPEAVQLHITLATPHCTFALPTLMFTYQFCVQLTKRENLNTYFHFRLECQSVNQQLLPACAVSSQLSAHVLVVPGSKNSVLKFKHPYRIIKRKYIW